MNLKVKKVFIILFSCLALLFIFSLNVNAANASISVDKSTVEVGNSVKITVSGKGVQWNLKLKVDGEVLKTSSELENYEANKNISFSATYTPKTTGTKKVTLEGSVTEFSDGSTIKSFESKSITVNEKKSNTTPNNTATEEPKEKSKNADLKTLGVTPKEYDFTGFSKNKTSYNVTVPFDVDSLKVIAKAADSNAKVKITGNSGFDVGSNNKITIRVTAEAGNSKTYTIKVTKLAEDAEKPGNLLDEENIKEVYLTSLEIEGLELSPVFAKDTYSYTAELKESNVTELKVNAKANDEKAKIEISGNTDLIEGENTINVLVTTDESDSQKVYQIVVNKEIADIATITEEPSSTTTDLIGTIKNYAIIAIIVVVLVIIAVIVLIILLKRENNKTDEEDDEEEIEETTTAEEYNVYNNDENEFVNSDIEKDNFIESLYNQRNAINDEEFSEEEKETLEEISNQTDKIFEEKVEGQSVEFSTEDKYEENPLEERRKRRGKGKHSL